MHEVSFFLLGVLVGVVICIGILRFEVRQWERRKRDA